MHYPPLGLVFLLQNYKKCNNYNDITRYFFTIIVIIIIIIIVVLLLLPLYDIKSFISAYNTI